MRLTSRVTLENAIELVILFTAGIDPYDPQLDEIIPEELDPTLLKAGFYWSELN